jgi:chromosome segregation ATPase
MERLKEENDRLKNELEDTENNLLIAAAAGKQLLERNNELQELVDKIHAECAADIDELKQRNHELKSRLDVTDKLLSHYTSAGDFDVQRQQFEEEKRAEIERLEEAWEKKMRELRDEWTETEENLKRERLTSTQLRQRLAQQETCMRELEEEIKRLECVRELEDEVQTLNEKLQDAKLARQVYF